MSPQAPYPIGTPGRPWGDAEKAEWLSRQKVQRSYSKQVVERLRAIEGAFEVRPYGSLGIDPGRYPLFAAVSRQWDDDKPLVLITGGVHGYETSGTQGALRFLATCAADYLGACNLVVAPCVSPWGYETINRWNPMAVDPNRSFLPDAPSEEAKALMDFVTPFVARVRVHIDLHETTDTDNLEFRPALAARDAEHQQIWSIPDGFYTVGDTARPAPEFQQAIIQAVEKVTHIAAPDDDGRIIGENLQQWGVINYPAKPLGLCMGMTAADYVTTTEVYPDSPRVDAENCIQAQVAAVRGGLEYFLRYK
jgi:hypothetical protein